jgi:hypothetical protein
MPTAEKTRPGPKVKPAAVRRTEWLKVRCSPVEMETIRARAAEAGTSVSEHVRLRSAEPVSGVRAEGLRRSSREARGVGGNSLISPDSGDSFEQRVTAKMRANGIPLRSAEILVKREMARESESGAPIP